MKKENVKSMNLTVGCVSVYCAHRVDYTDFEEEIQEEIEDVFTVKAIDRTYWKKTEYGHPGGTTLIH